MKPLTLDLFNSWLETYGKASRENDLQASADLFSLDAKYYETPFDEPMIGRDAIYRIGAKARRGLKTKNLLMRLFRWKTIWGLHAGNPNSPPSILGNASGWTVCSWLSLMKMDFVACFVNGGIYRNSMPMTGSETIFLNYRNTHQR